jgi:fructokinase
LNQRIGIFGEVLFDVFPNDQRVLGGAPFNVAWHLHAFGHSPCLISRIGKDRDGAAIRAAMTVWEMDTSELQTDPERPTGRVAVDLKDGEPTYDILVDRAYDAISAEDLGSTDYTLLYHGTLALRSDVSRTALATIKRQSDCTVFMDVNLRDPWWQAEQVQRLADEADWVKLNDEELALLTNRRDDAVSAARSFRQARDLRGLIVTLGKSGAFVIDADDDITHFAPTGMLDVVDTVGAGDAFAAVMIVGILRGWPAQESLQRAQDFASIVVRQRGAIVRDRAVYDSLMREWGS